MGWKGTLRSMAAAQRQLERDAERRRRELAAQRQQLAKMDALQRAALEVQEYENHIDLLLSVHKECSDKWDWGAVRSSEAPAAPALDQFKSRETSARAALDGYKPNAVKKLLGRSGTERAQLAALVDSAVADDRHEYEAALRQHELDVLDWEAQRKLAARMLEREPEAYVDAIALTDPFNDVRELGSSIEFHVASDRLVEAILRVNSAQVVPSETKSLLQSGKLSVKPMPKGRFLEIYQDYVCSCVLRIARELFALLPIDMVTVTAVGDLLNTQTGHLEEKPILSVAIPRDTLEGLNTDSLDPSDSMGNFVHRMDFRKTTGFRAVEPIKPSDPQLA